MFFGRGATFLVAKFRARGGRIRRPLGFFFHSTLGSFATHFFASDTTARHLPIHHSKQNKSVIFTSYSSLLKLKQTIPNQSNPNPRFINALHTPLHASAKPDSHPKRSHSSKNENRKRAPVLRLSYNSRNYCQI